MDERDRKHLKEQLKYLDSTGSRSEAVTTNHRGGQHDGPWSRSGPSPTIRGSSSSSEGAKKMFQPRGTVEFPLKFNEEGRLLVQQNAIRSSLSCNIPGERWNAKFSGSSLVRGPMGSATGSMLLSYDVPVPHKVQTVAQVAVGDQANFMLGAIHHTATAWYGVGMFYYPHALANLSPTRAFQVQSQQQLEHADLTVKFYVPTNTMKPNTTLALHHKPTGGQLELGMTRSQPHVALVVSPKLSAYRQLRLSCQWRRRKGIKFDASLNQSLGAVKTKNSSIGIGIRNDTQLGLSWLFTWIRGDVVIKIPVFILSQSDPLRYLCSCYLTFTSYLIQEIVADIWKLKPLPSDATTFRDAKLSVRAKAREDASKQMLLMQKQAENRRNTEAKKSGLVITKAVYYAPLGGGDKWDVTTQLQFWTSKSSLDLPALPKQNLLGFYDVVATPPSNRSAENGSWWQVWNATPLSKSKSSSSRLDRKIPKGPLLTVHYDYNGDSFEITVKDEDPLSLPSNRARKLSVKPARSV
jgi:hypothetical protein